MKFTSITTQLALAKYIKGYYPYELANLYDETPRTFMSWVKPHEDYIGQLKGKKFTPLQTERIFERLGIPPGVQGVGKTRNN